MHLLKNGWFWSFFLLDTFLFSQKTTIEKNVKGFRQIMQNVRKSESKEKINKKSGIVTAFLKLYIKHI